MCYIREAAGSFLHNNMNNRDKGRAAAAGTYSGHGGGLQRSHLTSVNHRSIVPDASAVCVCVCVSVQQEKLQHPSRPFIVSDTHMRKKHVTPGTFLLL